MIRGIYTGAAGMLADMTTLNTISNNLANTDTTGYKKDVTIYKTFPEMLIRRTNDNGLNVVPAGSWDDMPLVGKLGTGVEVNEIYTKFQQGTLQKTDNPLDLAIHGKGFFTVQTANGERYTRDGAFFIDREGFLVNKNGHKVLGEGGPIRLDKYNFRISKDGEVLINRAQAGGLSGRETNRWEDPVVIDRLKIRDFPFLRELKKAGSNYYEETVESGPAIPPQGKYNIEQGFLEKSNVNIIREMVKMIEIQRHYEANQKVITSEDAALGRLINEVAK